MDISVFYQLTGRLPQEELEFKEEDFIIHFYDTFVAASIKLLGKTVRCRINVLHHLLKKIGKEPNALFPFMKVVSAINELRKKSSSYLNISVGVILRYKTAVLCDITSCADEILRPGAHLMYETMATRGMHYVMNPEHTQLMGTVLLFATKDQTKS